MNTFLKQKCTEMQKELCKEELNKGTAMEAHQKALSLAVGIFSEVNAFVRSHPFPDNETEVYYFKFVYPYMLSEIFYHQQVLTHLTKKQTYDGTSTFKEHCKGKLKSIKAFLATHHELLCYKATGHTNLDSTYFLSNSDPNPKLFEEALFFLEDVTLNGYSIIIGKSIAYFRLKLMLKMELKNDQNHKIYTEVLPSRQVGSELVWTSQKVNLVELANALHAEGCFNNGNCDIAQIMCNLELAFNVSLGNFYDIYSNIKQRKKPTQFILRLQEKLQQKIEDSINQ